MRSLARAIVVALVASLVGGAFALPSSAQDPATSTFSPEVTQQLDELVDGSLELGVTGLSILVDVPGQGHYGRTAGTADFAGTEPLTEDAHFRIGSLTKTFTATVVLQLIEEGVGGLSLDDNISEFADAWAPAVLPFQSEVTVQELLQHTSGIADYGANATWTQQSSDPTTTFTPAELVGFAAEQPVESTETCEAIKQSNAAPPVGFCYSNTNFVLLGQIVEAVTGNSIGEEIAARLLRPLGLDGTRFPGTSLEMPVPRTVGTGAVVDFDTLQVLERGLFGPVNPSAFGAAGGMVSDRADVTRWVEALTDGSLLNPAAQAQRLDTLVPSAEGAGAVPGLPGAAPNLVPQAYGLGIMRIASFYGHNGEVDGWESAALRDPATGMKVVIMQNTSVLSGEDLDHQVVVTGLTSFPTNLFVNVLNIVPPPKPPAPPPPPSPPPAPPAPPSPPPAASAASAVVARPNFTG